MALLKTFTGVLQTDGYAAYKTVVATRAPGSIIIAHCWAHSRRRFFDLAEGGSAPIAVEALRRIGKLYEIEPQIRGQSADARQMARQHRSKAIVADLKLWCEERLREVSGHSPVAEAIRYVLRHWAGLILFLDDGRIELDTNPVERSMRPIALNRIIRR